MAIKISFEGINILLPSGSGPVECPNCKTPKNYLGLSGAYSFYGPNLEGKFVYCLQCSKCGYHDCQNFTHKEESS